MSLEEYRDTVWARTEEIRKTKAQLELNLAMAVKDNWKGPVQVH